MLDAVTTDTIAETLMRFQKHSSTFVKSGNIIEKMFNRAFDTLLHVLQGGHVLWVCVVLFYLMFALAVILTCAPYSDIRLYIRHC